ncbi:MAG: transglycosylase family protein [Thermoleophilia bacterium]|nr:transglycosylase family protein [Thermoleophilia bacterium]
MPAQLRRDLLAIAGAVALFLALLGTVLAMAPRAGAADAEALEGKLASAREEAGSLAAGLQQSRAALVGAESEAASAEAHEAELSGLLAEGQERTAELSRKVDRTRQHLAAEKARLQRARAALASRLVAIYESGSPDTASLIFGAGDYQELITRSHYFSLIAESDSDMADRVAEVRDAVRGEVGEVLAHEEEAVQHEEELAAARSEIDAVHAAAQASAAELQQLSAGREASLSDLRSTIDGWVAEVEEADATEAEAEAEVGRWLGGPYSIPTYIVMCESGGDYGAVNPSSGAGGAYQILPSTWDLYDGQGEPQNAPKAEQDRIAAEIWADSGGGAWVCA